MKKIYISRETFLLVNLISYIDAGNAGKKGDQMCQKHTQEISVGGAKNEIKISS